MKNEEYVTSLVINEKLVNIGLDDYGQCYFLQYYDEDSKQIKEVSLGTYNTDYEQAAQDFLRTDIQQLWDIVIWQRGAIRNLTNELEKVKEQLNEIN